MADEGLHLSALESLCRICGTLIASHKVTHSCAKYPDQLALVFGVNVASDSPNIHPARFCHNCYRAIGRNESRQKEGKSLRSSIEVVEWQQHTSNCSTCSLYATKRKGGRPRKGTKNRGRPPSTQVPRPTADELKQRAIGVNGESLQFKEPLHPDRFTSFVGLTTLICSACGNVVDRPVEMKCGHIACAACLTEPAHPSSLLLECPGCSHQLSCHEDIKAVSPVVMNILHQLQVHCDNCQLGCQVVVPLQRLREHSSQCHPPYARSSAQSEPQAAQLTPSKISAILQRPLDHPLSREETKAMFHLVRASLQQTPSDTPAYIECPTGGQVRNQFHTCFIYRYYTLKEHTNLYLSIHSPSALCMCHVLASPH